MTPDIQRCLRTLRPNPLASSNTILDESCTVKEILIHPVSLHDRYSRLLHNKVVRGPITKSFKQVALSNVFLSIRLGIHSSMLYINGLQFKNKKNKLSPWTWTTPLLYFSLVCKTKLWNSFLSKILVDTCTWSKSCYFNPFSWHIPVIVIEHLKLSFSSIATG